MNKKIHLILGAAALLVATPGMSAVPRGDEPVAVASNIKQGIDFVYVDPQMSTVAKKKQKPRNWLQRIFKGSDEGRAGAPNILFAQLAQGLQQYEATWGALPQTRLATGAPLKTGATGKRVAQLRSRLGLPAGSTYDQAVYQRVMEYQSVHGLAPADGIAGRATIASLNLGAPYFERRIAINMERAWRLPVSRTFDRYVVVDSGAAEAYLFNRDQIADTMRVVVGSPKTKTPMMAVLMRTAKANPYWNVPPELTRSLTARRILEQGPSYLRDFHYEVLSDWSDNAAPADLSTINWKQVAAGKREVRVRQLPGPWNSMGAMKFEMPNDYGIYLHDTPHKELFAQDARWVSNGCVRLQDYRRFASWVFPKMPMVTTQAEQKFELPKPVPVYMTYLTAAPGAGGIVFRPDPYGFDALAMPQMFAGGRGKSSAT
ncbi:L,D-transpeptidase family protein [Novosphingobium tardum]|uniref:L,D-transpeptidase family protein n=1 Tax=Novosphingobium tardum TaxID=1538021 RepID=A0ABV8RRS2_9SPHN